MLTNMPTPNAPIPQPTEPKHLCAPYRCVSLASAWSVAVFAMVCAGAAKIFPIKMIKNRYVNVCQVSSGTWLLLMVHQESISTSSDPSLGFSTSDDLGRLAFGVWSEFSSEAFLVRESSSSDCLKAWTVLVYFFWNFQIRGMIVLATVSWVLVKFLVRDIIVQAVTEVCRSLYGLRWLLSATEWLLTCRDEEKAGMRKQPAA